MSRFFKGLGNFILGIIGAVIIFQFARLITNNPDTAEIIGWIMCLMFMMGRGQRKDA